MPLELGSDIGGSLRAPAHFCGVCAHKPSLDLVPQRGSGSPERPPNPVRGDMEVNGPMARSAADHALALDAIAGPDEMWEGIADKLALPSPRRDKLADFRVLVIDTNPLSDSGGHSLGTGHARRPARESRQQVSHANPKMPDLGRTIRNYAELLLASYSRDLSPEERVRYDAAARVLSPEDQGLRAYELRGLTISHPEYLLASRVRAGPRVLAGAVSGCRCRALPAHAEPRFSPRPFRTGRGASA